MKNSKSETRGFLDGTALKLIAMVSMVFDHVGDMFFPGLEWPRMVGRLAMPIFAFCIAEGYSHTKDKNKYLLRMGIFALISEIPFDLAFDGEIGLGHQNIMVTFFLAIIALRLFDLVRGKRADDTGKYNIGRTILGVLPVVIMAVIAIVLKTDYHLFGVMSVFLFYAFKDFGQIIRSGVGVAFLALTRTMGYYCTTGLSFIPLALYNGKKGKGLKWLFYIFYPGHLLLLYLIKHFKLFGALMIAGVIAFSFPMTVTASAAENVAQEEVAEPEEIHGIYVSAYVAGTTNMMNELIEHIDDSTINAVAIDVKNDEGHIVFDMESELVDDLGTKDILVKDMPALLETLHEHDIYVIARCVAFRDPFIDEVKPEWMLRTADGEIYEDNKGFNWMDPWNEEVRQYLIEVALGCMNAGFDEVQYDYVRFPTGITEEDLGFNGYQRRRAIFEFVRDVHTTLKLEGMPLSLDVFGTVINSRVDRNIVGQEYSWLSMQCECLSPMIYPSHYYEGTMGKDYPDLYPYDTIDAAMKYSEAELLTVNPRKDRQQASVRPWLQGFTASYLKKYRNYGAQEIKDQIKAVNDNGVYSWIVWNPSCKYAWDAFK